MNAATGLPDLTNLTYVYVHTSCASLCFSQVLTSPSFFPHLFLSRHDASLLHSITRRFLEGQTVTRAGATILSINPCKTPIDADGVSLFHPLYMARYRSRVAGYVLEGLSQDKQKLLTLDPHIFDVAETASRALRTNTTNQAIVFMGESGSGKSEAYKNILQYTLLRKPLEAHGCVPDGAVLTVTSGGASASKGAVAAGFNVPFAPLLLEASFSSLSKRVSISSSAQQTTPFSSLSPSARGMVTTQRSSVFLEQLQKSHPLVEAAKRDSDRRKGPLGSARNSWFAS